MRRPVRAPSSGAICRHGDELSFLILSPAPPRGAQVFAGDSRPAQRVFLTVLWRSFSQCFLLPARQAGLVLSCQFRYLRRLRLRRRRRSGDYYVLGSVVARVFLFRHAKRFLLSWRFEPRRGDSCRDKSNSGPSNCTVCCKVEAGRPGC